LTILLLGISAIPITSFDNISKPEVFHPPGDSTVVSGTGLFNLTFSSVWNSTQTIVKNGDRVIGDRIILNATWIAGEDVNHTQIIVNATAVPYWITAETDDSSVEINTRALGANHTCTINMIASLVNGSILSERIYNVFLGNFFTPRITVLTPNGGEAWTGINNITWKAWDNNTVELLTFEVLLSSDGGKSFMLLSTNLEEQWFPWNSTDFLLRSTYLIEVRVSDGIYTAFDRSDGTFTAGSVVVTPTTQTTSEPTTSSISPTITSPTITSSTTTIVSTTTTPTTTATTAPTTPAPSGALAIILSSAIIGSAILAVFVYYIAGRKL